MPRPIITVDRLSKAYRIGQKDEIPDTLLGAVSSVVKAPLRNWQKLRRLNTFGEPAHGTHNTNGHQPSAVSHQLSSDVLWALRDVSFEVGEGEVVGIIGRNGAGKSTLLKILSRITEPTHGEVVIRGRVSSLLEVGTGFHPELTGRENIYMNGTILGMRKKEIDRKFDEIVDFSGVEKFLDTPIKRYSSGMQVRLAFAVAAHLEPEILIIDEVLAVGDAEFQKKCLGKMQDVARGGRTVLFVSHNTGAMHSLCTDGVVLEQARLVFDGDIDSALTHYAKTTSTPTTDSLNNLKNRRGSGRARFTSLEISSMAGTDVLTTGRPASISLHFEPLLSDVNCTLTVYTDIGAPIATFNTSEGRCQHDTLDSVLQDIHCDIPEVPLRPGSYSINAALFCGDELVDHIECAARFEVTAGTLCGRTISRSSSFGAIAIPHRWTLPG